MHPILERKDKTEKERDRRDVTNYSAVRHQDGTMIKPDKEYKKTNKLDWCNAEYIYEMSQLLGGQLPLLMMGTEIKMNFIWKK